MSDVLNMMEEDVSAADASSIEQRPGLGRVAELAKAIREKEQTVDNYEEAAKKAKAELLKLTDEDLPALMQEIGLKSFRLDDGATVEIKATYGGHIKLSDTSQLFGANNVLTLAYLPDVGQTDGRNRSVTACCAGLPCALAMGC